MEIWRVVRAGVREGKMGRHGSNQGGVTAQQVRVKYTWAFSEHV